MTVRRPRLKWFVSDLKEGMAVPDIWTDIPPISSHAKERLGYPTQKPLALLERIIEGSSKEDQIVLDPFCGCGTAVHAAQKLNRQWIGIDPTHLAIGLIERRLKDAFPGIKLEVHGTPKDFAEAVALAKRDPFQFQWWAVTRRYSDRCRHWNFPGRFQWRKSRPPGAIGRGAFISPGPA